jgi:excisionase family DNA binding protein
MTTQTATLLTPAEAARILNVSRSVTMNWLRDGTLPGKKVGKLWRISREDLDEHIANCRVLVFMPVVKAHGGDGSWITALDARGRPFASTTQLRIAFNQALSNSTYPLRIAFNQALSNSIYPVTAIGVAECFPGGVIKEVVEIKVLPKGTPDADRWATKPPALWPSL